MNDDRGLDITETQQDSADAEHFDTGLLLAQADIASGQDDVFPGAPTPPEITEVVPDSDNRVRLAETASIEDIRLDGDDLLLVQSDGSQIRVVGGALNVPTFLIGEIEIAREVLVSALDSNGLDVAAGPGNTFSVSSREPGGSGGDFGGSSGASISDDQGPVLALLGNSPDGNDEPPAAGETIIDDGQNGDADGTGTDPVGPDNVDPTGTDKTVTIAEDTSRAFSAADFGFADVDAGDSLAAVRIDTLPGAGSLKLNGTDVLAGDAIAVADLGNLVFTPAADGNGAAYAGFTFSVQDTAGAFDPSPNTISIDVTPVNDAPVAVDDVFSGDEDAEITGNVLTGNGVDTDVDGDSLSVVAGTFATAEGGSVTIDANGGFTYMPVADFNGADSFTYTLTDGTLTNTGTVNLSVGAQDDPPVAVADSFIVTEDSGATVLDVLANDTDIDGGPKLIQLVTQPANGTVVITNGGADLSFTPDADFNTDDAADQSFTYTLNDGSTATVTVTVTPVNDAPVAADDILAGDEDTQIAGNVLADNGAGPDSDIDGDALTVSLASDVSNGTLVLNPDGSFTYTPDPDFNGADSFTYTVNDGTVDGTTATVTLTIGAVNDAPETAAAAGNGLEDAASIAVALSGSDPDGSVASFRILGLPANGTLYSDAALTSQVVLNGTVAATGNAASVYFVPDADYSGTPSFTYAAIDDLGLEDSTPATAIITVTPVDDAPVAVADSFTVTEDSGATTLDVLANDTDIDGGPKLIQSVTQPANGTVVITNGGADLSFTPDADFNTDGAADQSFTYTLNDGSTATVSVTVTPVNDAPVVADDNFAGDEDTQIAGNVLADNGAGADADIDGDALTVSLASDVSNGTLVLNANGSFTYTPDANFNGADSFTYTVNDGTVDGTTATVTLNVGAVNDAPVAVDDIFAGNEDAQIAGNVLADNGAGADSDIDGDALTVSLVTDVSNGTLVLNANGSFTYTPDPDFSGADSFSYTVNDGTVDGTTATVILNVGAVNDAPETAAAAGNGLEDAASIVVTLSGSDPDGSVASFRILGLPANGTLYSDAALTSQVVLNGTVAATGNAASVYFVPDADYNGTPGFTYAAIDDLGLQDPTPATATINVAPVDDAPVAVADSFTVTEDSGATVLDVLANDTDVDAGPKLIQSVTQPANGTVVITNGGADLSFTPDADFNTDGAADQSFTYTLNDGSTATVSVTVTPVNDAPVAADDIFAGNEDAQIAGNVLADNGAGADSDIDGDALSVSEVEGSAANVGSTITLTSGARLTVQADGSYSYDPNGVYDYLGVGQTATDSFSYQVSDGNGGEDTATVTLTISGVNDAPVAVDDTFAGNEDAQIAGNVLFNDTDADAGDPLTVSLASDVSNGTLVLNADGSFTYTPDPDFNGADSFTYTVNDGTVDGNTATVTLNVGAVNDAPETAAAAGNGLEDAASIAVALSGSDPDGSVASFRILGLPANGTLYSDAALTSQVVLNGTVAATGNAASVYFVPDADYNGTPTFTYAAIDDLGLQDPTPATATITVTPVDDAPVAVADSFTVTEDSGATTLDVLANDTDIDGGLKLIQSVTQPANGTVVISNGGADLSFTPDADFNTDGAADQSFTYTLNDGSTATVSVTVTPVNDAPVAVDDIFAGNEDAQIAGNVLADNGAGPDSDIDGDALSVSLASDVSNGTLVLNANGSFTYTPDANFNGADSFTYTVNDGTVDGTTATVTLNVGAVNDAPETAAAAGNGNEDAASITVALSGSDPDGSVSSFRILSLPANGTLYSDAALSNPIAASGTVAATGNAASVYFVPDADYNGTPSFTYAAIDDLGLEDSTPAAATINVTPVNDAPVTNADSYSTDEDTPLTIAADGVLANDSDVDDDPLSAILVDDVQHGTLKLNTDGSFTYTPDADFSGTDSFTYKTNDSTVDGNTETVTINVAPVADGAIISTSAVSSASPTPLSGDVVVNTTTTGVQYRSSVASNGNGYVVTWIDLNSSPVHAFFQRYSSDGTPQGVETEVDPASGYHHQRAVVAEMSGGYVIAWIGDGVQAQRYASDGTPIGSVAQVNTDTEHVKHGIAVSAIDSGYVVTWRSDGQDGFGGGIYAQRFDDNGIPQGGETLVNTTTANYQEEPVVAQIDGGYVIVWSSYSQSGGEFYDVYMQRYTSAGVPQGGEERVNSFVTGSQDTVDVVAIEGGYVVVWADDGQDGSGFGIYSQRFDNNGNAQGGETRVNTETQNDQIDASVAAFDGGYVVVWTSRNQDGDGYGRFAQRFANDGSPIGGEFQLNADGAGDQRTNYTEHNTVAVTSDGVLVTVWKDGFERPLRSTGEIEHRIFQLTTPLVTDEDTALGLSGFSIALSDTDGSETITSIVLDGFPAGTIFSVGAAGTGDNAGKWVISSPADIDAFAIGTATMTPPADYNGTFTLSIAANVTDSATYADTTTASDSTSTTTTVDITVTPVNDAPEGADKTIAINEDGAHGFSAADFGFSDVDAGDSLAAVRIDTLPGAGSLQLNGNPVSAAQVIAAADLGNLVFTPDANGATYAGFTFSVQDSAGAFDATPNTISIDVTPVNDAPVAVADSGYDVDEDVSFLNDTASGNVLTNDSDPDSGDHLNVVGVSAGLVASGAAFSGDTLIAGTYGYLSISDDGEFRYTLDDFDPDTDGLRGGQAATDVFTYTIEDDGGLQVTATLTIDITGANDRPFMPGSFGVTAPIAELADASAQDIAPVAGQIDVIDNDLGDPLGLQITGVPALAWSGGALSAAQLTDLTAALVSGRLTFSTGIVSNGGTQTLGYTWDPAAADLDFLGGGEALTVTFAVAVGDGSFLGLSQPLTFTVNGANDAPVISSGATGSEAENTAAGNVVYQITASDADAGDTITYGLSGADAGLFDVSAAGEVTFKLPPDFEAPADTGGDNVYDIVVHANDGTADTTRAVAITVTDVSENTAPTTDDILAGGDEDTAVTVLLAGSDPDGNLDGFVLKTLPANGTLYLDAGFSNAASLNTPITGTSPLTLYFKPDADWSGSASFTYAAIDNESGEDASPATATITVTAVADAPVISVPGIGDPVPLSGDVIVNATTAGIQQYSSVSAIDGGGYVVTWSSWDQDGDGYGIYAQRYASDGTPQGGETRVNATTANLQSASSVSAIDGGYVVTWTSFGQDGDGSGIYAQRYDSDGTPQGGETRVNATTADPQSASSVSAIDGGYVVTWTSFGQDGDGSGIYAQRYDSDGTPQGGETLVNTTTADYQLYSSVSAIDGGYVVTWTSRYQDGDGYGIYAQRYASDGTPQGGETLVNTTTADDQLCSSVSAIDGGYVVTWTSFGQDGDGSGIYAQRYASDGTPQGGETLVNTTTADDQLYSSVSAIDGGYVVTWSSYGQDGNSWGIYAQRYASDGTPQGVEFRINADITGHQQFDGSFGGSGVAVTDDGVLVAVWDQDFGSGEIEHRRFELPSGTGGNEDTDIAIDLSVALSDTDGSETLSDVTISDVPAGVILSAGTNNNDGTWTLTQADLTGLTLRAPQDWNGSFDLRVSVTSTETSNGDAATTTESFTVTIDPVNDAPVTNADSYSTSEDTPLVIGGPGVLDNDTDAENDQLTAALVTGPSNGSVTLNPDGSFTYTPDAEFSGVDSFTYKTNDGTADGNTETVTINVNPVNDAPVTVADSYSTDEDTPLTISAVGVLINDTDVDGDALTAALVNGPANGSLTLNADGSFTYTPDADFSGTDSFTYKTNDGTVDGNTETVTINVNPVNDAPVVSSIDAGTVSEDDAVETIDLLAGQTDVDGDTLSATGITVVDNNNDPVAFTDNGDGTISIDPDQFGGALNAGDSRTVTVSYGVNDGIVTTPNTATLGVTGADDNGAPTTGNILASGDEDTAVTVSLTGSDSDGNLEGFVLKSLPANGTLYLDAGLSNAASVDTLIAGTSPLTLYFKPDADWSGTTDFTYAAHDTSNAEDASPATATIDVAPVADAPAITAPGLVAAQATPLGDDSTINTGSTSGQAPAIAGIDGGFVATWTAFGQDNGLGGGVFAQRFGDDGVPLGDKVLVNTYTADDQQYSAVVAIDGGYAITWQSVGNDGAGWGIFVRRYASDGTPLDDAEIQVNTTTAFHQSNPEITAIDGGFVVVWKSDPTNTGDDVFSRVFAADGTAVTGEIQANTHTSGDHLYPSVASFDGGYVVTWVSAGQDGSGYGVMSRRFANDGTPLGNEVQVNTTTTFAQVWPQAAGIDGGYVITWASYDSDGDLYGVYAQRYADDGTPLGEETLVNTVTDGSQTHPSVAATADGYIISWTSTGQDGDGSGIYAQRFASDGTRIGGEFRVNATTAGSQYHSTDTAGSGLAVLPDGTLAAIWRDSDVDVRLFQLAEIVRGQEDQPIALDGLSAAVLDTDGSESLTALTLAGVPAGATLSDGTNTVVSTGVDIDIFGWTLSALTLALGDDVNGTFTLTLKTTVTDSATLSGGNAGDTTTAETSFDVVVMPVNDAPGITSPDTVGVDENTTAVTTVSATDVDGDALTYAITGGTDGALFDIDADTGELTFKSAPDFEAPGDDGTDNVYEVEVTASDGNGGTDVQTISVTVNDVAENVAPVAGDDSYATNEDVVAIIGAATLLANDADVDGDTLTISAVDATSDYGATLTLNGNGTISYDPTGMSSFQALGAGQMLEDSFTYTISDGNGGTDTATVTVSVYGVNNAPEITSADTVSIDENIAAVTTVTATDADGDTPAFSITGGADAALFAINETSGELSFKSAPNYEYPADDGADNIYEVEVTAADGNGGTDVQTISVTVNDVADTSPPVAADDSYGAAKNGEMILPVERVDDQKQSQIVELGNGTVVAVWATNDGAQDGSFGAVKARLYTNDGVPLGSEFLVNDYTDGRQHEPSVTALADGRFVVAWNSFIGEITAYNVQARLFEADGQPVGDYFKVNGGKTGSDTDITLVSLSNGGFAAAWYEPGFGNTPQHVSTRAFDADGNPQTGEQNASGTDNSPQSSSIAASPLGGYVVSWWEYNGSNGYDIYARAYGNDGTPDPAGAFVVNSDQSGTQKVGSVAGLTTGNYLFTWITEDTSQDGSGKALKGRVLDASGNEIVAEFLINTSAAGDQTQIDVAALANGGFVATWTTDDAAADGSGKAIMARVFNAAGEEIVPEFVVNVFSEGNQNAPSVSVLSDGGFVITWTSGAGVLDTDGLTVSARYFDADGTPRTDNVIDSQTATDLNVLSNDTDADGDALSITSLPATSTLGATLTLNGDGTVHYDPTTSTALAALHGREFLADTFTYEISDGFGGTDTATVTVEVVGVNVAPVASADDYATNEDTPLGVDAANGVLANDSDVDGDGLTAVLVGDVSNGTLTFNGDGSFGYTPDADFSGTDSFTYKVNDGTVDGNTETVTIDVAPVADGAVITVPVSATTPLTGDVVTNTTTEGAQRNPSVAVTDTGYVVTWATASEVYAQRYSGDGTPVGDEIVVASGSVTKATVSAIDGGFVATWQNDISTVGYIGLKVFSNDGTAQGDAQLANANLVDAYFSPSITAIETGFVVVWTSDGQDGSGFGVYAQRFSLAGVPQGSETLVNSTTADAQGEPAVAAIAGGYVVTWDSVGQDGSNGGIFAQRFANDGTALGDETQVNTYTDNVQSYPAVAAIEGGYVVVWQSALQDGSGTGIYFQRFSADGTPLGMEMKANTFFTGSQSYPNVAGYEDGFVVTWSSASQDGSGYGIFGQRFGNDGSPLGGEFRLNDDATGTQLLNTAGGNQGVAITPDGVLISVWEQDFGTGEIEHRLFQLPVSMRGTEDAALTLSKISVTLSDTDGSETITSIVLDGFPAGTNFSVGAAGTGDDAGKWVISAPADIDAFATGAATMTPATDYNGTFTLSVTANVTDSATYGDTTTASDSTSTTETIEITITPVNDAPVTVADSYSTDEDTPLTISATGVLINDTDVDGDALTAALVNGPANGSLTLNADGSFTYTPDADFSGTDSFTYKVNDGTVDGNTETVTINVNPVNDAPVISDLASSVTFLEDTVNAAPQIIDADVAVSDVDSANFDGGTLTVSGKVSGEDMIRILEGGAGGTITVESEYYVLYNGDLVGTISDWGFGTNDFVVSFRSDATPATVEALIESLTYANNSDTPTATRTLTIELTDGDGGSTSQTVEVNVTPEAEPEPVLELSSLRAGNSSAGFAIDGVAAEDNSGYTVSGVGDMNGDGIDDFAILSRRGTTGGSELQAYVVFGKTDGFDPDIDLAGLDGTDGFRFTAPKTDRADPFSDIASAGDFNGDGLADLAIGVAGSNAVHVLFGSAQGFAADYTPASLTGANGFTIKSARDSQFGVAMSYGDTNGDGYDDLVVVERLVAIPAQQEDPWDPEYDYYAWVHTFFGKADGFDAVMAPGDLASTKMESRTWFNEYVASVSAAGDINGDGYDDVFMGADHSWSYAVFGGASGPASVSVDTVGGDLNGNNGFIQSEKGPVVAIVGDINGDGYDDQVVTDYVSNTTSVMFGHAGPYHPYANHADFTIAREQERLIAIRVSGAGDVNGDGYDDMIIGYGDGDPNGVAESGQSYVIFGRASGFGTVLDPKAVDGTDGFVINGIAAGDWAGTDVAAAGDVNGDGFDDLIVGAAFADPNGNASGQTYILFGGAFGQDATPVTTTGTSGAEILIGGIGNDILTGNGGADVIRAGAGDDNLHVSDAGFFKIDAGHGTDTLTLDGSGLTLDLTQIANNRIESIEKIDLTGSGDNSLILNERDVLDMTSDRENGIATLRIDGDTGDAVTLVGTTSNWQQSSSVFEDDTDYLSYTNGNARVLIASDLSIFQSAIAGNGEPVIELSSLPAGDGSAGFVLTGIDADDDSGYSVSSAGDVNGDGFGDILIGAYGANQAGAINAGETYVVFGSDQGFSASIDLSTLNGSNGFVLTGIDYYDQSGIAVSSAGDVNGDGIDDILIGASGADLTVNSSEGETYVVFGKSQGFAARFDLATLDGTNGFVLTGIDNSDLSGNAVSSAGDVNGDGFGDLLIGAHWADQTGADYAGESYVVFGSGQGFAASLSLGALDGSNGFVLTGIDASDYSGYAVSSAGDINGDGFDDILIGAFGANKTGAVGAGESYVVFGKSQGFAASFDLAGLNGSNGFVLTGIDASDYSGHSVSSAGDVNGDGFDDILIGASNADLGSTNSSEGETYVVFGKSQGFAASFDLAGLNGSNGFVLTGIDAGDNSGFAISSAGDFNGDGFDDILIGAYKADQTGANDAGESYVLFGKSHGFAASYDLSALDGTSGVVFPGIDELDRSGYSVSSAGDVNGDGFDDILIGAYNANQTGANGAGESYVVFGGAFGASVTPVTTTGTSGAEILIGGIGNDILTGNGGADVIRAGAGDDNLHVSDAGFFKIDAGHGTDTLTLDGSGITLDLTQIANNKIESIEKVDLTGSGDNTLILTLQDLLGLSNDVSGGIITLTVDGDAGDRVKLADFGDWAQQAGVNVGGIDYAVYTNGMGRLLVQNTLSVTVAGDPIILDLDGDGLRFTAASFDINHDGHADSIGWPGAGDGLLVVDLDGSGVIEDGSEVFSPHFDGGGFATSIEALAAWDSDGDGSITALDAGFGTIGVWVDANSDGVSDAGELQSLSSLGIVSIGLGITETDYSIDGQHVFAEGLFEMSDGSTGGYFGLDLGPAEISETRTVTGGEGDDILAAILGHDTLTGGAGADTFVFDETALGDAGLGIRDLIADYSAGEGDLIDLSALLGSEPVDAGNAADYVQLNGVFLEVDIDGSAGAAGFVEVAEFATAPGMDALRILVDHQPDPATVWI